MPSLVDRLPAFAIPFVTRSLRGGRGRRFAAMSLGLALLTLLGCLWIGSSESREARRARFELEEALPSRDVDLREFAVVRRPGSLWFDVERLESEARAMAQLTVHAASRTPPADAEHLELHARAKTMAAIWPEPVPTDNRFPWDLPDQVERLENILDREGVPRIVDLPPPLAIVTGGLLILLFTVIAPLLVAVQQASERHENTLQPLTGTSLDARELMLGLACGPLAIVAIFAAPIAALFVVTVVVTGAISTLLLVPALAGTAIGLVFGAQLLAHLAGSRFAPGAIAAGLSLLLGLFALVGFGLASELDEGAFAAVFPQAGAFALLAEPAAGWRHVEVTLEDFGGTMLVGTLGAALLGFLALRALTRHVEGRPTLLEFHHALLGALTCITMIAFALPASDWHEPVHYVFGLPALALPFLLLIMARVPIADVPSKRRRIPLERLLGEFGGWTLVHVIVAASIDRTASLHPITLIGVGWCVLVLVLVAVRLRATPGRILGHVWALACLASLPLIHGIASIWAVDQDKPLLPTIDDIPGLMLLAFFVFFWVPISLFEHLRMHVVRLR